MTDDLKMFRNALTPKAKQPPKRRRDGQLRKRRVSFLDTLANDLIRIVKVDSVYLIHYERLVVPPPPGLSPKEQRQIAEQRTAPVKRALGCRLRLRAEQKCRKTTDAYEHMRIYPISTHCLTVYRGVPTYQQIKERVERFPIPEDSTLTDEMITEMRRCLGGDTTAVALFCVIPGINHNEDHRWLWILCDGRDAGYGKRHIDKILDRLAKGKSSGLYSEDEAKLLENLIRD